MAQLDSLLVDFSAIVSNEEIQLDWILKGGYQCNGTIIQRSTDAINFENIGDIVGLCGSADKDEFYSFTDVKPVKNTQNYYRLQLGSYGHSRIINKSFFLFEEKSLLIFPNPAVTYTTIVIENPGRKMWQFNLYTSMGILIYTTEQREQSLQIERNGLAAGTYYFSVLLEDQLKTGKIIFQ